MGFSFSDAITDPFTYDYPPFNITLNHKHDDYLRKTQSIDYLNSLMLNFTHSDYLRNIASFVYGKDIIINSYHEDKLRRINFETIGKIINLKHYHDDTIYDSTSYTIDKKVMTGYFHDDYLHKASNLSMGRIVKVNYNHLETIYDSPSQRIEKFINSHYFHDDLLGILVDAGVAKYIDTRHKHSDSLEEPTVGWVEGGTEQEDDASPDQCSVRSDIGNVKSDYESQPVACYWEDTGAYLTKNPGDYQSRPDCQEGEEYTSCVFIPDPDDPNYGYYSCIDYYAKTSELVKVYYTCEVVEQ